MTEYKYIYQKKLKRIENGIYKVNIEAEDYYTREALENLIKTYKQKLEHCNEKIMSYQKPEVKETVINTMLMPHVGSIVVLKYMRTNNIPIHEDYHNNLTEEDIKQTYEPLTEQELEQYNKARPFIIQMIEQDIQETIKQKKEIDEALPLWTTAIEKGQSETITEHILNL